MNISVLNFDAYKIDVNPASRTLMGVSAYDADGASVLANFDIEQIVNHFGAAELLMKSASRSPAATLRLRDSTWPSSTSTPASAAASGSSG